MGNLNSFREFVELLKDLDVNFRQNQTGKGYHTLDWPKQTIKLNGKFAKKYGFTEMIIIPPKGLLSSVLIFALFEIMQSNKVKLKFNKVSIYFETSFMEIEEMMRLEDYTPREFVESGSSWKIDKEIMKCMRPFANPILIVLSNKEICQITPIINNVLGIVDGKLTIYINKVMYRLIENEFKSNKRK